jgi:hypothetical protein
MTYSLIHPSRGRPHQAFSAYKEWMNNASNENPYEYILSIDKSDAHCNEYQKLFEGLVNIEINDNKNCVQATNEAARSTTCDIIIYVSDDFGCPNHWDVELQVFVPEDKEYLLWVDDGIQGKNAVITIPIMSRGLYQRLGYFWHPAYESMWVDVDLYHTCQKLGVIVDCKTLLFEHRHYSVGKFQVPYDDTYRAHDNTDRNNKGKEILARRQAEGWI